MTIDLSIIIVNWNGAEFLPKCLKSIVENPPSCSFEIVVVDNASTDKSVEWMKSAEAKNMLGETSFRLIESKENLGFGRANNLAFKRAQGDFILVLNPDTRVKEGSLDKLLDVLQSDDDIGAVAPKLLNDDGSLQPSTTYWPPTPSKIIVENFAHRFPPRKRLSKYLWHQYWDHNETEDVPAVWGAAILFKRDVLDKLEGFDKQIFMYAEDIDICIRLHKMSMKLIFLPTAEIIHSGGKSADQIWSEAALNIRKMDAEYYVERKHLFFGLYYSNMLVRLVIDALRVAVNPLRKREDKQVRQRMRTIIRNLRRDE